jgi:tetratricopeptide (TPR) repeat protein
LAEAHLGLGDVDKALSWAERSLERALTTEMRLEEGCTRRVLGSIYRAQGRLEESKASFEHSLRILDELESPYQVARTAIQLAALHAERGDETQATSLREQAVATFERLGAELDLTQ